MLERLGNNKFKIHLWDEGGYDEIEWHNYCLCKNVLEDEDYNYLQV